MILWTLISTGLSLGAVTDRNARIGLAIWLVASAALAATGGNVGHD